MRLGGLTFAVFLSTAAGVIFSHIVNDVGGMFTDRLLSLRENHARLYLISLPLLAVALVAFSFPGQRKSKTFFAITTVLKREELLPRRLADIAAFLFSSAFNLAFGIALGRFGPCCTIGAWIGTRVNAAFDQDSLLYAACGLAACVSTCMAVPLSAVFFVVETARELPRQHIIYVVFSSAFGFCAGRWLQCGAPFASRQHPTVWHMFSSPAELGLAALIGVAAAVVHRALSFLLALLVHGIQAHHRAAQLAPFAAAVVLGGLIVISPAAAGTSDNYVRSLLDETASDTPANLLTVLLCKALALTVCLAGGYNGGVLGPCITIGACLAFLAAALASSVQPALFVDSHLIAAAGAAGMVSAALRMPIFAALCCCEIFGSIHGAAFVALSAAIAAALSPGSTDPSSLVLPRAGTPVEERQ